MAANIDTGILPAPVCAEVALAAAPAIEAAIAYADEAGENLRNLRLDCVLTPYSRMN